MFIIWCNLVFSYGFCAEPTPEQCHRRLLAKYLARQNPDVEIIHL